MKKRILSVGMLLVLLLLLGTTLYWNGNYVIYIISYICCFTFLLYSSVFVAPANWEKIVQLVIYTVVVVAQILFAVLIIRPSFSRGFIFDSGRLLGIMLLFTPFQIRQVFFLKPENGDSLVSSIEEWSALSYAQLLYEKEAIVDRIAKVQKAGKVLSKGQLWDVLQDLPRHKCFSYVNNGSLTDEYFEKAYSSLDDGYLYLILTRSKSAVSEVIELFTNRQYNHVSISFDRELLTIISYNGGERVEPPGLNPELVKNLVGEAGASVMVYRLPASYEQKKIILDKVYEINTDGSAYNILGLLFKFSYQPNIMFCSQFVYTMLETSGINYFEKDATHVIPTDFVELDYYRRLEFVTEITLKETASSREEYVNEEKLINENEGSRQL
ncbi:MAG: hypothetical protein HFI37_07575 [Lachnospiraceae bacterium]|nr:hypothetical protein [Lachnospiraceae bacterium]